MVHGRSQQHAREIERQSARRELVEYLVNVVYVFLVFGVFTEDRRLILAAYHITYANYGIALIQALVLAKIIMIGSVFRFARGLEDKPLIYPTLWKTAVFAVFPRLTASIPGLPRCSPIGTVA